MSPALAKTAENTPALFTSDQEALLRRTVAKGATNDEFMLFAHLCRQYALDPFNREIWCIVYEGKSGRRVTITTSRDGYLKICQRDPDFLGINSCAVRANDDFEMDPVRGTVLHRFAKGTRGPIIGAWAIAEHRQRKPVISFADFSEYYKETSETWRGYPSAMICKVAETMALKRQGGISGLVTQEEMGTEAPLSIEGQFRPTEAPTEAPAPRPALPTPAEGAGDPQPVGVELKALKSEVGVLRKRAGLMQPADFAAYCALAKITKPQTAEQYGAVIFRMEHDWEDYREYSGSDESFLAYVRREAAESEEYAAEQADELDIDPDTGEIQVSLGATGEISMLGTEAPSAVLADTTASAQHMGAIRR